MMFRKGRQWLLLLAAAGAAACAHQAPQRAPGPPPVLLRVVNRTSSPAAVWMAWDSAHWRLGAVAGSRTAELPVPRWFLERRDSVRFLAFRGDTACVQDARFPTDQRRYTMVLTREFPNPDRRSNKPCHWD